MANTLRIGSTAVKVCLSKRAKDFLRLCSGRLPRDYPSSEFERVIADFGYDLIHTTHGWKAAHNDLINSEAFPSGYVAMGDHSGGTQGQMHSNALRDFLKALRITHPYLFRQTAS